LIVFEDVKYIIIKQTLCSSKGREFAFTPAAESARFASNPQGAVIVLIKGKYAIAPEPIGCRVDREYSILKPG